ncbi:hypothetical protein B0H14DRAFT_2629022 [Mycena olivaceomarginata]|nr:hypothetical protein B0H14DRAFT_2629022 [Mycena olivaceomarginata]
MHIRELSRISTSQHLNLSSAGEKREEQNSAGYSAVNNSRNGEVFQIPDNERKNEMDGSGERCDRVRPACFKFQQRGRRKAGSLIQVYTSALYPTGDKELNDPRNKIRGFERGIKMQKYLRFQKVRNPRLPPVGAPGGEGGGKNDVCWAGEVRPGSMEEEGRNNREEGMGRAEGLGVGTTNVLPACRSVGILSSAADVAASVESTECKWMPQAGHSDSDSEFVCESRSVTVAKFQKSHELTQGEDKTESFFVYEGP